MSELSIACTLSGDVLRARRDGLLAQIANRVSRITAIASGYRLEFEAKADVLPLLANMIEAERQCCRFLRFNLTVEPNLGPIIVELTGPTGTPAFLEELLETS